MSPLAEAPVPTGFVDAPIDSQRVFRTILEAMARPGTIVEVPVTVDTPSPLDPATAALLLCLVDHESPVWFDSAAASAETLAWIRFHCGCPISTDPAAASFAVVADAAATPPLAAFHAGSDEYPDRSATIILQVASLIAGDGWTLEGPGIREQAILSVAGFPPRFKEWVRANHELFPRGVDLIFTCGAQLAALPRSTRLVGG
jgi:alpha-D-ribose 1-methylphosphonate 5-triphosphate synthase subunit PhnH